MRLIDADALKDKFTSWIPTDPQEGGTEAENVAVSAIMEIEQAPTIDAVSEVHGWWELGGNHIHPHWRVCSRCQGASPRFANDYNYCPHCGAKMDKGSENET